MRKRTKNIKTALGVIGFLAFFFTIGTVETDTLTTGTGFIRSLIGISIFGSCVMLNNWIDGRLYKARLRKQRRQVYTHSSI
mgnify:FL=1